MYIVIYEFLVKENKEQEFIDSWESLTKLILQHEGSLGSRLHKQKEHHYIAYAQWPSKEIFDNAGANLPDTAISIRKIMGSACQEIKTLHKLEVIADLLS